MLIFLVSFQFYRMSRKGHSQSQITSTTAQALREASSRGLKVVIATGKIRPAAISVLKMVDLAGMDGIISEFCPGVFVQGLLVYGRQGREIFRSNLDPSLCREAFIYSLKHEIPLIVFSEDRCLTLFGHPLVDTLHTLYHEPKAEIMPSIEHLLAGVDIQNLIFLDTAEGVATALRPYWSEATKDRATVVQAVPDMLEIVPSGTSKGNGVRMLLDHWEPVQRRQWLLVMVKMTLRCLSWLLWALLSVMDQTRQKPKLT